MKSKSYENKNIILLGGATATGKSDLAYNIAKEIGGEIVNADSMQIYKNFPILTSQPTSLVKSNIKHHLYGYVDTNRSYSAAAWLKDCLLVLNSILKKNKIPIVVGGTGLYLEFLYKGINQIPAVSVEIRKKVNNEINYKGLDYAYDKLKKIDLNYSEIISKRDKQRIARSLEVYYQTGNNISYYHKNKRIKTDYKFEKLLLMPNKEIIKNSCEMRFIKMLDLGLVEEVSRNHGKVKNCNVANAIGFRQINSYLKKEISLAEATEISVKKTKEYSKRQCTWFKNRFEPSLTISSFKNTSLILETLEKIN